MIALLKKAVLDEFGDVSHARIIALVVCFSATVFMWRLIALGEMQLDYFIAYLVYGVVHQSLNKSLDVLGAWFGLRMSHNGNQDASHYHPPQ